MTRLIDVKLIKNKAILRSSKASCRKPVISGPKDVPTDVIIIVKAKATANSLGRIPGKWKGTVTKIGKKAQATPLKNESTNSAGTDPVKTMPTLVPIIKTPRT
jgi:hypothetical protein